MDTGYIKRLLVSHTVIMTCTCISQGAVAWPEASLHPGPKTMSQRFVCLVNSRK